MSPLYATDIFNGDGQETEFDLSFEFINRDHVQVSRIAKGDGAETALTVIETGTPVGDEYRWENDTRIRVGVAPTAEEQLRIQRDTPENQQLVPWSDGSYLLSEDLNTSDLQWLYGLQELEDKFGLLQTTAIKYLGAIDLTVDEAPAAPEGGDFFINTGDGSVLSSWTGIAGDQVVGSEQVIYNASLLEWEIFEVPSSKIGVVEVEGIAPIVVDDTDSQRPVVSITGATASADGSMSAADKAKLDGISPGATVGIPDAPSDGDQYARQDAAWTPIDIPPETIVSPTPPPNPIESQLWFDSTDGRTYVYYTDNDSSQWVESNPSWNGSIPDGSVTTPKLEDGSVTPDKLDREYLEPGEEAITQIVAGNNVTITPSTGKGIVTINSTGGGGGGPTTPGVRYQQGTITPSVDGGVTLSSNAGFWSRVGNSVSIQYYVSSGVAGGAGAFALTLPYITTDNYSQNGSSIGSVMFKSINIGDDKVLSPYVAGNSTIVYLYTQSQLGGDWEALLGSQITNNASFFIQVTYLTDDTTYVPAVEAVVTEDIQGTGGSGGGGGSTDIYGTAKASCQFAGSDGSRFNYKNVASVLRTGPGLYEVKFNVPMASDNYTIVFGNQGSGGFIQQARSQDATGFTIRNYQSDTVDLIDANVIGFAVFDDVPITVSGGSGGGTDVNYNGASAWGSFNADGTAQGSFNCSAVKGSPGSYVVTFDTPMPNDNYAATATAGDSNNYDCFIDNKVATGFTAHTRNALSATAGDSAFSVAVFASNAIAPQSGVGADAWGTFSGVTGDFQDGMNIASTTKTGTGDYDVVFIVPMPSTTYAVAATTNASTPKTIQIREKSVNGFRVLTTDPETGAKSDGAVSFTVHASSTVTPTYTWTRNGTTLEPANAGDNIVIGGDPNGGAEAGTKLRDDGILQVASANGANLVYAGYQVGTPDPTSFIRADGSAELGKNVVVNCPGGVDGIRSVCSNMGAQSCYYSGITNTPAASSSHFFATTDNKMVWRIRQDGIEETRNVLLNLEADDDTKYTSTTDADGNKTRVYNGAKLDVKALLLKLHTAAERIEALEAKVTQLEGGTNS